jgi:hypothetical protein
MPPNFGAPGSTAGLMNLPVSVRLTAEYGGANWIEIAFTCSNEAILKIMADGNHSA